MITKSLKNIVVISLGYSFRTSIKEMRGHELAVIQARDILENAEINSSNLVYIQNFRIDSKYFLQKDDILLSARGKFWAGICTDEQNNSVASSSLYTLRVKDANILPGYLAIYLNLPDGQKKLNSISSGSSIKSIARKELEEVEVAIPSIEKQAMIIKIFENRRQQEKLLKDKIFLNNKIAAGAINKLLK